MIQRGDAMTALEFEGHIRKHCIPGEPLNGERFWVYRNSQQRLDSRFSLSSWPSAAPLLIFAAEYGRYDLVEILVRIFKCNVHVSAGNSDNAIRRHHSALHLAVRFGHVETVRKLLELGADPDKVDREFRKPVHLIIDGIQDWPVWKDKTNKKGYPKGWCKDRPRWSEILSLLMQYSKDKSLNLKSLLVTDDDLQFFKHTARSESCDWRQILEVLAPSFRIEEAVLETSPSPLQELESKPLGISCTTTLNQPENNLAGVSLYRQYCDSRIMHMADKVVLQCQEQVLLSETESEQKMKEEQDRFAKILKQKDQENKRLSEQIATLQLQIDLAKQQQNCASADALLHKRDSLDRDGSGLPSNLSELSRHYEPREYISKIQQDWQEGIKNKKAHDALNHSLYALSLELYSSSLHFVDELIQNAIDSQALAIRICLCEDGLCFANGGTPFNQIGVSSICDIGQSSKPVGDCIGHKGLGFKSVFAVSDSPFIYSKGQSEVWSFGFRVRSNTDWVSSFLIPRWIDPAKYFEEFSSLSKLQQAASSDDMVTQIYLPLGEKFRKRIRDVSSYLLELLQSGLAVTFWKTVREVSVIDHCEGTEDIFRIERVAACGRLDFLPLSKGCFIKEAIIDQSTLHRISKKIDDERPLKAPVQTDALVVRAAVTLPPEFKLRDTGNEEKEKCFAESIVLCFPQQNQDLNRNDLQQSYPIYAFLPIHTTAGFSFLMHANWHLASSRDSVLEYSEWNKCLRNACAQLTAETFSRFLKDESLPAKCEGLLRYHLEQILKMSGLSSWWMEYKKEVIDRLKNRKNDVSIFEASPEKIKCLKVIIPELELLLHELSIVIVTDSKRHFPELSVYDLIVNQQDSFFFGRPETWWDCLFSQLLIFIKSVRMQNEGKAFMDRVFWSKPIFRLVDSPSDIRVKLDPCVSYLVKPAQDSDIKPVDYFPIECLPGFRLLDCNSADETELLLNLGVPMADSNCAVRLFLLHHIALHCPEWYIKYGLGTEARRLGLHFLYENKTEMYLQWKSLLSTDRNFQRLANLLPEFPEGTDFDWCSVYKKLPEGLENPLLWLPCGEVLTKSVLISANAATLSNFMMISFQPESSKSSEHFTCKEIQTQSDAFSAVLFDLFLLEIGCRLPAFPNIKHFNLQEQDTSKLFSCVNLLKSTLEKLELWQRESSDNAEPLSLSSVQQFLLDFIGILNNTRVKNINQYQEIIQECRKDLIIYSDRVRMILCFAI